MKLFSLFLVITVALSLASAQTTEAKVTTVTVDAVKTASPVQTQFNSEKAARKAVDNQLKYLVKKMVEQKRYSEALYVGEQYGVNVKDCGMIVSQIKEGLKQLELEWRDVDREYVAAIRLAKSNDLREVKRAAEATCSLLSHVLMRIHVNMLIDEPLPEPVVLIVPKK